MKTRETFSIQDSSKDQPQTTRVCCVFYPVFTSHGLYPPHCGCHPYDTCHTVWGLVVTKLPLLSAFAISFRSDSDSGMKRQLPISAGHQSTSRDARQDPQRLVQVCVLPMWTMPRGDEYKSKAAQNGPRARQAKPVPFATHLFVL